MTVVSDVEIRLRADIARLSQDLAGARREVNGAINGMSGAVEKFKDLLGGLAAGAAVAGFAGIIKNSIDAADALNDMSARTKVAIEDLAGLAYAAKLGDTSLDGVASSISKLGQNIGKEGEKFRALGITATEPLEAFKQLADIFKDIQDPQQRAAFGAEALGKSWQEAAVLLDGGAAGIDALVTRGKELSGITEETAAAAGKFNDGLDTLGFAAQGVGTRIAADLLPIMNQLVDDFTATGEGADEAASKFSPLTEALRALIILGGNVAFVLKGVGTEIGVWAAQIGQYYSAVFQFLQLDFKGGVATLRSAFGEGGIGDMAAADAEKARTAFDAWEKRWVEVGTAAQKTTADIGAATKEAGDSSAKVAAFLNSGEIKSARDKAAADAESARKKEQAGYAGLIASIKEKMAADRAELEGGAAITAAQKVRIKLDEELAAGKITLTDTHLKEVRALIDEAEALEKNAAAAKQVRAAVAALADERDKNYEALVSEAAANEELIATYGKTKVQILQMTLARDQDRLSRRGELELSEETVAQLEREIAARKRNIAAAGNLEILDQQKKAADDASAAQVAFWKSVDDTAHATFVSILDGSKNTAQRLKDTFKNIFFDWLYQQTLKKWIFNVGMAGTSGTSGAAGAANALTGAAGGGASGGGGSLVGLINMGKSIYEGFSTGFMSLAGSLGGSVSSLGAAFGSEAVAAFGAGLQGGALGSATASAASGYAGTTAAGYGAAAAPYVAGLAGVAGGIYGGRLISGGYGSNSAVNTGTAIGAAVGSIVPVLGTALGALIGGAIGGIWNRTFGRKAKEVTGSRLEGTLTPDGATASYMQDWFQKGGWFKSDRKGTDTEALGATELTGLSDAYKSVLNLSKTFGDVLGASTDSLATRVQKLSIDLTGLKDATAQQEAVTKFFTGVADSIAGELVPNLAKFQMEGETLSGTLQRVATNYSSLDTMLTAVGDSFETVGLSSIAAREAFIAANGGLQTLSTGLSYFQQNFLTAAEQLAPVQKQLADALKSLGLTSLTTNEQFKTYLLGIDKTTEAGATLFAQLLALAPAFNEITKASEATKKAAEELAAQQAAAAAAQVEAAKSAARSVANAAFDALSSAVSERKNAAKASFDAALSGVSTTINQVTAAISNMRDVVNVVNSAVSSMLGTTAEDARKKLAEIARTRRIPQSGELQSLASAASQFNANDYTTALDARRAQLLTTNSLEEISAKAAASYTNAQAMLASLQMQYNAIQAASLAEQARLDSLLTSAQAQINAVNNVSTSVLSLSQAITGFASAISAATSAGGGGSSTSSTWDASTRMGSVYTAPQSGLFDSDAVVRELKAIAASTANSASAQQITASSTTQLANQFDNVSAGGNALLTEASGVLKVTTV